MPFRTLRTLVWGILFALAWGGLVENRVFLPSLYAQETDADSEAEDSAAEESETDDSEAEERAPAEDTEQEAEDNEPEPEEKRDDSPPKKAKEEDEPVSDEEQEKAEDAAGEEVDEEQEAADKREDEKAAADEAAGAEVEIDESGDEEEEPEDPQVPVTKPPVEEEPQPTKETAAVPKRVIGATATVMEKQSELLFKARVDSGAKSCSLHIEDYKIENESEQMAENIGKVITFHIKNGNQESHWLEAKIAGYVIVKTAAHRERRYKVPLTLRYKDFEKTVLVTLNNREKMEYPLLLGRNFLVGDFLVDVEVENEERHRRATLN
jgi:hypothetical protein